jgi:hypothetical protein
MNASLKNRFASTAFRQAMLCGLIGALLTGFTVVSTVTSTNIGPAGGGAIRLVNETFSNDTDVDVSFQRIFKLATADVASPVGDTAPGLEATSAIPQINNNLVRNKYAYEFTVREAAVASWSSGENFKIDVWMDDGTSNSLIATLYTRQVTVDNASIEGVKVVANGGLTNALGDVFKIVITRQ